jgi:flagellar hook assembly protein FlgD
LRNPTTGKEVKDIHEVLVKSIVGIRPSMTLIDEIWDGRDYAQQEVPDGTYPFRFVTSINGADIDTMTGEIIPGRDIGATNSNNAKVNTETASDWKINYVADTYQYQNLHKATVAIGDGKFVCEDWEKTVFFYPNPLNEAEKGTLEITKMPVPGTMSIKYYNLAGDLVKDSNYECIDANNYITTMGKSLLFYPDNDPQGSKALTETQLDSTEYHNVRNAAMRCKWNATNQHGKKVARGVYFGLVDFKAKAGREHCQKVVKIIVP